PSFLGVPDGVLLAEPWPALGVEAADCGVLAEAEAEEAEEAEEESVSPSWQAVSPNAATAISMAAAALRVWRSAVRCGIFFLVLTTWCPGW
ncbi:hypothetical protein ACH4VS_36630, partial [Streptomyces hygroscopicus]|uniref:hypothetical protein n=1 Tax=Streptomyces hygroscopicus TaxID=1912 RepID=UPI00379EC322